MVEEVKKSGGGGVRLDGKPVNSGKDDVEMIDTSAKPNPNNMSPNLKKNKSKVISEEEVKRSHCTHPSNAKCINCLGVTKDSAKDVKY